MFSDSLWDSEIFGLQDLCLQKGISESPVWFRDYLKPCIPILYREITHLGLLLGFFPAVPICFCVFCELLQTAVQPMSLSARIR